MREHTDNQAWHWEGLDHSSAAQLLQDVLPGTEASPLVPLGQGDFCLAFRHREKVIRVARHAEAVTALRRETCVLARIADRLPLPVPRLAVYDPPGCPPFTTHPEIRGDALTREAWERLPAAARDRTAAGLADFLLALHTLPVEIGLTCRLEKLSASAQVDALQRTTRETIWDRFSPADQRRLDAFLAVEAHKLDHARPSALIHGDIAPGHVIYDPETGELTGIIDFGDIAIGDPARDFIYIYEDFGLDLLNAVLRRYAGGAPALLRDTRKWYLLEATAWTVEMHAEGHSAEVEHGLAEVRRELAWVMGEEGEI